MERKKLLNKSRQPFLVPQASPQPEKPSQCNLNLPIYYKPCDPKDFKGKSFLFSYFKFKLGLNSNEL